MSLNRGSRYWSDRLNRYVWFIEEKYNKFEFRDVTDVTFLMDVEQVKELRNRRIG